MEGRSDNVVLKYVESYVKATTQIWIVKRSVVVDVKVGALMREYWCNCLAVYLLYMYPLFVFYINLSTELHPRKKNKKGPWT